MFSMGKATSEAVTGELDSRFLVNGVPYVCFLFQ